MFLIAAALVCLGAGFIAGQRSVQADRRAMSAGAYEAVYGEGNALIALEGDRAANRAGELAAVKWAAWGAAPALLGLAWVVWPPPSPRERGRVGR